MKIIQLIPEDHSAAEQAAKLLVSGFVEMAPDAWPDIASAQEEVRKALEAGKICLVAKDAKDQVVGWVGGLHAYARVWELHPLVVSPQEQGRGVGRELVKALEQEVKLRNGLTVMLGTDDVANMTTLSGTDLYQNTWQRVKEIKNLRRHPYEFYEKCGYVIVGVVPDANGYGKPDILMAKRIE